YICCRVAGRWPNYQARKATLANIRILERFHAEKFHRRIVKDCLGDRDGVPLCILADLDLVCVPLCCSHFRWTKSKDPAQTPQRSYKFPLAHHSALSTSPALLRLRQPARTGSPFPMPPPE